MLCVEFSFSDLDANFFLEFYGGVLVGTISFNETFSS